MNSGEAFKEAISAAANSCDGHVTNGSLEAIMKIVEIELDKAYKQGYADADSKNEEAYSRGYDCGYDDGYDIRRRKNERI